MKRLIYAALACLLLVVLIPARAEAATASGTCGDNLTWTLDEGGTLTISGEGAMKNYDYGSAPWFELRGQIKNVAISETVTTIGNHAFCALTSAVSINLPDALTSIGDGAFKECTAWADSLVIPDGVTSIGQYAFYNCHALTGSLHLPDGLTTINDSAFYGCWKLNGTLKIPSGVTSIGSGAFHNCSRLIGTLEIPDGVTTIGGSAFYGCAKLSGQLVIPEAVTKIGNYAFYGCEKFSGELVIPDSVSSIGNYVFAYCTGLTSLRIGSGLTTVSEYAFLQCNNVKALDLGENVTTIEQAAFAACLLEGDLCIPDSVQVIDSGAFYGFMLTSIDFGEGLTKLGGVNGAAISNGKKIKEITFTGKTPPTIYGDNFSSMAVLETVWVPAGTLSAYTTALSGKLPAGAVIKEFSNYIAEGTCGENLTWTLDENGLLTISGSGAMKNYSDSTTAPWFDLRQQITALSIEKGVTSIGSYAFENCSGLTGNLVIPEGVTTIATEAFSGCSGLTGNLVIPDSVTTIGYGAFSACSGLTGDLVIPKGVTRISNRAFYNCSGFSGNLIIPEGVTNISISAFENCSGLTGNLVIPNGVTYLGDFAFRGCSGFTGSLIIPDTVTYLSPEVFNNCTGLTGNLVIPKGISTISYYAFYNCNGLTGHLVIPENIASIQSHAFYSTSFSEVTFTTATPPTMEGEKALYITGLETVWVPTGTLEAYTSALSGKLPAGAVIKEMVTYIAEGTCGDNLTWTLDENGKLTISGTGAMYDYSLDNPAPWYTGRARIRELVIEYGVTTIGSYAFYGCSGLTSVEIPESVVSIGEYAFGNCSNLKNVDIPDSVGKIDGSAWSGTGMGSITIGGGDYIDSFEGYEGITEIWFRGDFPGIAENAFRNVVATAYYPAGNKTWTADKLQNYGGTITWVPYNSEAHTHNGNWFSDDINHWKECPECGIVELAPHESGSNSSGRCTVCNHLMDSSKNLDWFAERAKDPDSTFTSTGFFARIMEKYGSQFSNP